MGRRKGRRFGERLFNKFDVERGARQVYSDHEGYHQATRRDPASLGTSSLLPPRGLSARQDYLAVGETLLGFYAWMLPHLDDLRVQYRLSGDPHAGDITAYGDVANCESYPGTVQVAETLGLKHPLWREPGKSGPWPMTTDIVITLRPPGAPRHLLAISRKDRPLEKLTKGEKRTLRIEREYWICQGAEWLLITPDVLDPIEAEAVTRCGKWAMCSPNESSAAYEAAAEAVLSATPEHLPLAYHLLMRIFACHRPRAQGLFWGAVWNGYLHIDLGSTLWVSDRLRFISRDESLEANPLFTRRSAWTE